MGDLEEKFLKDCDNKSLTWWRFIDDIFIYRCYGSMVKKNLKSF